MLEILSTAFNQEGSYRDFFKVATSVGKEQYKRCYFNTTFSFTKHHGNFFPNGAEQGSQNNLLEWARVS